MATLKDSLLNGNNILEWEDLRFPMTASRIDTTLGRIDYNYFNGAVGFASNARYPEEPASMLSIMPHEWKEGSAIKPHIHWMQTESDTPNWLLAYKILENGGAATLNTDFSNHTLVAADADVFTYTSGNLNQISTFPDIDMTGLKIATMVHFVIFRDTSNVSTLFVGADPVATEQLIYEFDAHYQLNTTGSTQEFIK